MNNDQNNLHKCASTQSYSQQRRLSNALRLLDGISRLPLKNDSERAEQIRRIYGEANKREKV